MYGRFKLDRSDWQWDQDRAIEAGKLSGCELTIALAHMLEEIPPEEDRVTLKEFQDLERDAARVEEELRDRIAELEAECDDLATRLEIEQGETATLSEELERLRATTPYDL